MDIPERISIRETMHGHGAKGMAIYGYEDTGGLGIRMEARRENSRCAFVETWFLDALPDRSFSSFAELRTVALPMTDEQVHAATIGCYPLIRETRPDSCGNPCRLCPRPETTLGANGERIQHETWRVTIAYSWKDLHSLSVCDAHLEQFQDDPKGLRAAIEAEVQQRRARAAAQRNPA